MGIDDSSLGASSIKVWCLILRPCISSSLDPPLIVCTLGVENKLLLSCPKPVQSISMAEKVVEFGKKGKVSLDEVSQSLLWHPLFIKGLQEGKSKENALWMWPWNPWSHCCYFSQELKDSINSPKLYSSTSTMGQPLFIYSMENDQSPM